LPSNYLVYAVNPTQIKRGCHWQPLLDKIWGNNDTFCKNSAQPNQLNISLLSV
jgi:hypothetical protein